MFGFQSRNLLNACQNTNREDPDQTCSLISVCAVCLALFEILEHLAYTNSTPAEQYKGNCTII